MVREITDSERNSRQILKNVIFYLYYEIMTSGTPVINNENY